MKFKKGDSIKMIAGNDRGKQGTILSVLPHEGTIIVEGVNMKKKHVRPRQQGKKGELVRIPAPFPSSRAMIVCARCGKPARIGIKKNESGQKARVCRKCGSEL